MPGPKATISLQYFTSRGLFRDHLVDLDELINHQGALLPPRTNCVHKGRNIPSVRETEEDVLPDRGLFLRLLTGSHVGVALVRCALFVQMTETLVPNVTVCGLFLLPVTAGNH